MNSRRTFSGVLTLLACGGLGYGFFGLVGLMAGLMVFLTGLTLYVAPEEPLPRSDVKFVDHTGDA